LVQPPLRNDDQSTLGIFRFAVEPPQEDVEAAACLLDRALHRDFAVDLRAFLDDRSKECQRGATRCGDDPGDLQQDVLAEIAVDIPSEPLAFAHERGMELDGRSAGEMALLQCIELL